jgi:S-adenosylmethionine hydrolase
MKNTCTGAEDKARACMRAVAVRVGAYTYIHTYIHTDLRINQYNIIQGACLVASTYVRTYSLSHAYACRRIAS